MSVDVNKFLSKFAYIFVIFIVITGNYVTSILSCQMQKLLEKGAYARHILGVLMIFIFIMLLGGYSFNQEEYDMSENSWSSANAIDTMVLSIAIYILFLISSKSRLLPNILFFSVGFILYCINTQRSYEYVRKKISDETNEKILVVEKVLLGIAVVILVVGFIDYYNYKKKSYGKDFSLYTFIVGTIRCSHQVK
jgi:hypothetical protein